MANNNRTEAGAAIEALAAVVDLEELKEAMNDFFAQSCIFRKDVASTDTAPGASKTIDFLDIDYIAVTQTNITTAYTLSNVQQGEIKYLKIIKTATFSITFIAPSIDTTANTDYIRSQTEVLYQVTNKDGTNILVSPISKSIIDSTETIAGLTEKATNAEGKAGTADKNITADLFQGLKALDADVLAGTEDEEWISPAGLAAKDGNLITTIIDIEDWNMDLLATKNVNHSLTLTKIRDISVMIRDNTDTGHFPLISGFSVGGAITEGGTVNDITTTIVTLGRVTGGFFDGVDFDSITYNRGWVTIKSIP